MAPVFGADAEWLEADGLGGFASGTVAGIRTRRYHALLLAARTPPTDRFVLVNGLEVWAKTGAAEHPLSSHSYAPGVIHPAGFKHIESFGAEPWPTWVYKLDDRTRIRQEVFVPHGHAACVVTWRVLTAGREVSLRVRPLLSVRDYHSLHHENAQCSFHSEAGAGRITWRPYWGAPGVTALFNGWYGAGPEWYRSFLYSQERARGLDCVEDCSSPGEFGFALSGEGEACLILATDTPPDRPLPGGSAAEVVGALRERETARRSGLGVGLARSADAYIVERGIASTIIAGYPWFTDWGRDTFLSMRGLCLATGRLEIARRILTEWSRAQVEGLLPNRFPDAGEAPEFNSVDAALWYVQAAHDFLVLAEASPEFRLPGGDERLIRRTCVRALQAYARGTRLGIGADEDGLLRCGEGGSSLTWMDARAHGEAVTPRVGKPVEVQALWINALMLCSADEPSFGALAERALASFAKRFWDKERRCLYDVVDADHRRGETDGRLRPNQLLAVGGLTHQLIRGTHARAIVDLCERELLTPMGLRTLAPGEPGYVPHYIGPGGASGPVERDHAYHNGTVWPWLVGPFAEAWVRVRRGTQKSKREARERFLRPLLESTGRHGLGHIAEIADAEEPFTPRGCPFQAWSVGEALRLDRVVLSD